MRFRGWGRMKTKQKTVKTNKATAKGLFPKLRFPEFLDKPKWKEQSLREILNYERPDKYIVIDTNYQKNGIPVLTANKSFILGYTNENQGVFKDTPVIIFDDFTTDKKYVNFSFKVKSSAIKILKRKGENSLKIIFELMVRINFDAAQHKRYYISEYQDLTIYLPTFPEQQKIADCLSSIDDLITAQAQKLDTLKTHKKGLMQQLFPAEGETVPKLRFPEFRDARAWAEKPLGKVAKIITGNTPKTAESNNYGGDRLFVSPADISDQRYISTTKTTLSDQGFEKTRPIKANSILFVCIGSTIGKVAQNKFECATNQQINSIVPFNEYSNDFIYSFLEKNSGQIAVMAGKQAVPIINKTLFSSVIISYPSPPEQHKIADCLSSIDELITAQAQKLDNLKAHKKGLIQQLFPSADEVTG